MIKISRQELARYLAGELSQEDELRVQAWLADHPTVQAALSNQSTEFLAANRDPARFLDDILGDMSPVESSENPSSKKVRGRDADKSTHRRAARHGDRSTRRLEAGRYTRTTRAVIALVVFVAAGLIARELMVSADSTLVYSTAPGEYTEIALPDGSEVMLNVSSRMEVIGQFGAGQRTVRLEGEAYFDIAFDPRNPFVIDAGEVEVTVLGTAFDVMAYPDDDVASVVVDEGSVRVRSRAAEETLEPGQRATLDAGVLHVGSVDPERSAGWREGRLEFRATPMHEVARWLERWYGIEVTLQDSTVEAMKLDGVFETDAYDEAARIIAAALEISAEIHADHVAFKKHD